MKPESYCPVSQLLLILKLAERAVQSQLLTYLVETTTTVQGTIMHTETSVVPTTALIEVMDLIITATNGNLVTATMSKDQKCRV